MSVIVEVNYLAVLICGIIALAISAVWYSPVLLGRTWMDEVDKSEEDFKKSFHSIKTYAVGFLSNLFIAFSLAQLLARTGSSTMAEGIRLAFLCWIGFIIAPMIINYLFEGKSIKLILVDGGYHLITLIVYGVILGAWTA
jgi:hypothetical protein